MNLAPFPLFLSTKPSLQLHCICISGQKEEQEGNLFLCFKDLTQSLRRLGFELAKQVLEMKGRLATGWLLTASAMSAQNLTIFLEDAWL